MDKCYPMPSIPGVSQKPMSYKPPDRSTGSNFDQKRNTQRVDGAPVSKTFSGENSPERDIEVGFEFQKVTNTRGRFSQQDQRAEVAKQRKNKTTQNFFKVNNMKGGSIYAPTLYSQVQTGDVRHVDKDSIESRNQ